MPPSTRHQNPPEQRNPPAAGPLSNQSILIPRDKVPRGVLALTSPGTRAAEVHVGDKLPHPSRSYQCKTNGGHQFLLSAVEINSYVRERDSGVRCAPARADGATRAPVNDSGSETDSDSEHQVSDADSIGA
jgi:hypothetical protein